MIFRCPHCRQDKLFYHKGRYLFFPLYKIQCLACSYKRVHVFKKILILNWLGDYENIERINESFY